MQESTHQEHTHFEAITRPLARTKLALDESNTAICKNEVTKMALQIFLILTKLGNHEDGAYQYLEQIPILNSIKTLIAQNKQLVFILPAFPAKSSNRNKTEGPLPDLGEVLALNNLNQFCKNINKVYKPGAQVLICSDGRVFNDLVFVKETDLLAYDKKIRDMISEFQFSHLKTFNLDDYLAEDHPTVATDSTINLQSYLLSKYGPELELIKAQVKSCNEANRLFNGIHRFIKEDLSFVNNRLSKNQISLQAKEVAYQVIQRSKAWDQLLEKKFPHTLRLSIHPYPITNRKFGIKLLEADNCWATPWHNVVIKNGEKYQLIKRIEALRLGATLKSKGDYSFYEL